MPAHLSVQFADAIHPPAAMDRKIGHVEGFRTVSYVLSSHREQILNRNGEFILRKMAEILTYEIGIEAIKSGTDRGMRSKDISSSRDAQGEIEWLLVILHVGAGPFERSKRRVSFIEMTYLRLQS